MNSDPLGLIGNSSKAVLSHRLMMMKWEQVCSWRPTRQLIGVEFYKVERQKQLPCCLISHWLDKQRVLLL